MIEAKSSEFPQAPTGGSERDKALLSIVVTSYSTRRLDDIFELLGSIEDQT